MEIPEDNEHSVDYYESQAQELSRLVEEPQIAPLPNMGPCSVMFARPVTYSDYLTSLVRPLQIKKTRKPESEPRRPRRCMRKSTDGLGVCGRTECPGSLRRTLCEKDDVDMVPLASVNTYTRKTSCDCDPPAS